MPEEGETCVICGQELHGKATFTAGLMLGNMSRHPYVGPYCENCGPPRPVKAKMFIIDCPDNEMRTLESDENTTGCDSCRYHLGSYPFRSYFPSGSEAYGCMHPHFTNKKDKENDNNIPE